jgi:nucleoside-diphosphate-sugar epimerase
MEDVVSKPTLRIALAGGQSLLGQDLENALRMLGHEPMVFSRNVRAGDYSYSRLVSSKPDVIVNLVGGHKASKDPLFLESLTSFSHELVLKARFLDIPLVHVSSGAVFGTLARPALLKTQRAKPPFADQYQEGKILIETLHDLHRAEMRITDLRLFSFVGANFLSRGSYFTSLLYRAFRDGNEVKIQGPDFLRDFTGPLELGKAIEASVIEEFSGVLNLHSESPVSRSEVVRIFIGRPQGSEEVNFQVELSSPQIYCAEPENVLPGFHPPSSETIIRREIRSALSRDLDSLA